MIKSTSTVDRKQSLDSNLKSARQSILSKTTYGRNLDTVASDCHVCGGVPTIKSHLIPVSFIKEILYDSKSNEKHIVIHNDKNHKRASDTGLYERGILCAKCDNVLGAYENYTFNTLKKLRRVKVSKKFGNEIYIPNKVYPFRAERADELIRFACGIIWKYASVQPNHPGFIKIGNYKDDCADICFRGAPIPDRIDLFIERDISAHAHGIDATEVYYYGTPSLGIFGHRRMARFNVGGFYFYLRLDHNGPSDFATKRCWVKGKTNCYFNVNIRVLKIFEEIRQSMYLVKDDLARINKKITPARTDFSA